MSIEVPLLSQPEVTAPSGAEVLALDSDGLKRVTSATLVGVTPYTVTGGSKARSNLDRATDDINVIELATGDGVADDTAAFSWAMALAEARGGGTVIVHPGTYGLTATIQVPSNVSVVGIGMPTITRLSGITALFITKSNGSGGYDACQNVTLRGLVFDGKRSTYLDTCTLVVAGHAKNINIDQCTFKNLDNWHLLELNACKDCSVTNCTFQDYGTAPASPATEMVQLDMAIHSGAFPWYGPYDDTNCENILIDNCKFYNYFLTGSGFETNAAVGHHSFKAGSVLKNITISNCVFDTVTTAVKFADFNGVKLLNNRCQDVACLFVCTNNLNDSYNLTISGNKYYGRKDGSDARAITINPYGSSYKTYNVEIVGNHLENSASHCIGFTAYRAIVADNVIQHSGKNGIYAYGGDRVVIEGNIFYSNYEVDASRADFVVGGNGSVITDNVTVVGNVAAKAIVNTNVGRVLVASNNIVALTNNGGATVQLVGNYT
jgi:hypothetical protein